MRPSIPLLLAAVLIAPSSPAPAQESECVANVPRAVRPFVARGACALVVERADLDRDGRADYVVVLERRDAAPDPETQGRRRTLLVLVAGAGGVREAARSEGAVLCSRCGGAFGDPLAGVEARPGGFTIHHYGGSSWRWGADFTFAHSRRDRAWQLVRVDRSSFHAGDPERTRKERVSRPPRDFGKVDLRTFDAWRWLERER